MKPNSLLSPEALKALGTAPFDVVLVSCMDRRPEVAVDAASKVLDDWGNTARGYGRAISELLKHIEAISEPDAPIAIWNRALQLVPDASRHSLIRRMPPGDDIGKTLLRALESDAGQAIANAVITECRELFDEALSVLVRSPDQRVAAVLLSVEALNLYREWHDSWLVLTQALLRSLSETHGKHAVGQAWAGIGRVMLKARPHLADLSRGPEEYDVLRLLEIQAAGMRGHPTGPNRTGSFDVLEEDDRFVLEFDGCGSGGALRRDVPSGASGVLDGAGTTSGAHGWTAGESNVPLYCAHCFVWQEVVGPEIAGYPLRITDYNSDHDAPCRWLLYKDLAAIPVHYRARTTGEDI